MSILWCRYTKVTIVLWIPMPSGLPVLQLHSNAPVSILELPFLLSCVYICRILSSCAHLVRPFDASSQAPLCEQTFGCWYVWALSSGLILSCPVLSHWQFALAFTTIWYTTYRRFLCYWDLVLTPQRLTPVGVNLLLWKQLLVPFKAIPCMVR